MTSSPQSRQPRGVPSGGQFAAGTLSEAASDVHLRISAHQHEEWQMRESPSGGRYCAACGENENRPTLLDALKAVADETWLLQRKHELLAAKIAASIVRERFPDARYLMLDHSGADGDEDTLVACGVILVDGTLADLDEEDLRDITGSGGGGSEGEGLHFFTSMLNGSDGC